MQPALRLDSQVAFRAEGHVVLAGAVAASEKEWLMGLVQQLTKKLVL